MAKIRLLIHGVTGRMGQESLSALCENNNIVIVGGVCKQNRTNLLTLPDGSGEIALYTDIVEAIETTKPDVVLDFSNAGASIHAGIETLGRGIYYVTGTSGLTDVDIEQMDRISTSNGVGVIIAPNFSMGAVLLMELVKRVAPFFDYVDVIESHHEGKIDSPSGTSIAIAKALVESSDFNRTMPEKESLLGAMGSEYKGVGIHSIRQPGSTASHKVVFGSKGQTLSLSHDTIGRECYMSGVAAAVIGVFKVTGVVVGLNEILGLR